MILVEMLAFVFGAGIRCWELMPAEVYGRKGYRYTDTLIQLWQAVSSTAKGPFVLNALQRHMEICKNVGCMDICIYCSEADG